MYRVKNKLNCTNNHVLDGPCVWIVNEIVCFDRILKKFCVDCG